MDEKQINNIESFFSIKGLKEEKIITKAKLSVIFIGIDCKYGEKAEIICREFVDSLRTRINYAFLLDGETASNYIRTKDYFNEKNLNYYKRTLS